MSLISTQNDGMSVPSSAVAPAAGHLFVAPRPPVWKRINYRMVFVIALLMLPVFGFFYQWARQEISGGIINYGSYFEVNLKAMSSFDMNQVSGRETDIPPKFRALEGKRVLLVGEMWAPRDAGDGSLGYFQLVYSRTKCCFNGPPLAQHFVDSNVKRGAAAYYSDGMVRVWGTLHIRFRRDPGGVIKSIYAVDVDKVEDMG
jgi:hypothetical protein